MRVAMGTLLPGRSIRFLLPLLIVCLCVLALPQPAAAQVDKVHVTLTPYAGWAFWGDGVNFHNNPVYGGRVGLMFNRYVGVEGDYGRVRNDTYFGPSFYDPAADIGHKVGAAANHWSADLLLNLGLNGLVSPYILGGYQVLVWDPDDPVPNDEDSFSGFEFGAGLLARVEPRLALRAEVRDALFSFDVPPARNDDLQHNFFLTLGVQFSLGGRAVAATPAFEDVDGDGVRNSWDRCPGTPRGAYVDACGCPWDSDRDGVWDGIDQCEGTPPGTRVDARGCPLDSDRDGVHDGVDQCPDTPYGVKVDARGCPLDSDRDGVYDGLDKCPDTPYGTRVGEDGCPDKVSDREAELLEKGRITLHDVNFETAKWNILPESYSVLDEVGRILVKYPDLKVEIGGHTDWRGSDSYNMDLSQKRAQSVLNYLTGKFPGINASQYTTRGYGESRPIATNDTATGMAENRRVEFTVLNTEVLKKAR